MLDPTQELVFGIAQSIGAIATAIALVFLIKQTIYTRNQAKSMQHEITTRLRPWIYRMPSESPKVDSGGRVTVRFNNTGQIAANRIYFYSVFKLEQPDKTTRKKDLEDYLIKEEPIVHERLLFPNEETEVSVTMDKDALSRYYTKPLPVFLHILMRYNFRGGDDERQGTYIAIFRLQRFYELEDALSPRLIAEIVKEWAE
jgi:hypothetical protein